MLRLYHRVEERIRLHDRVDERLEEIACVRLHDHRGNEVVRDCSEAKLFVYDATTTWTKGHDFAIAWTKDWKRLFVYDSTTAWTETTRSCSNFQKAQKTTSVLVEGILLMTRILLAERDRIVGKSTKFP